MIYGLKKPSRKAVYLDLMNQVRGNSLTFNQEEQNQPNSLGEPGSECLIRDRKLLSNYFDFS